MASEKSNEEKITRIQVRFGAGSVALRVVRPFFTCVAEDALHSRGLSQLIQTSHRECLHRDA